MKKIILIFILSIITLSGNYSAYAKELSNKIDNTQVINDKNLNSLILNKVRDIDTYEPVPKYLQDRYIKIKENDGTTFDKDYNVRLVETLVEEVYPYLTILDKRRSIEKDEKSKVIKKVLISKLNDKSE